MNNKDEPGFPPSNIPLDVDSTLTSELSEEHPRIALLRSQVNSLPVEDSYRAALLQSIETYGEQILERPEYPAEEGWDDLEALQQTTLSDRAEQWFKSLGS